jgi:hypothetical protein
LQTYYYQQQNSKPHHIHQKSTTQQQHQITKKNKKTTPNTKHPRTTNHTHTQTKNTFIPLTPLFTTPELES